MDEFFRPIASYPGYRVSRTGEVQSCWGRHARPTRMTDTWMSLKPVRRFGYLTVNLSKDGRKAAHRIHRLVLEAFVGPCPEGMVACHNDGDPGNNNWANLRWDSPKANSADALKHGTRATGSRCRSKLTEGQVLQIRRLRAEGVPVSELAASFKVSPGHVWSIVNFHCWRHLPSNLADGSKLKSVPFDPQEWRGSARC